MGGGSAEEEACGFILRLHNGTFTHRVAEGNWVDECLVMLPVRQVNSQDLAYIISRVAFMAFTVFIPRCSLALLHPGLLLCVHACMEIFK